MRRRMVLGAIIAGALVGGLALVKLRGPRAPRRIFLIVVDTLRADHLSCYGSATMTPNIDRLAARGQIFRNAVSSFHQTTMSMGALFTGRTPSIESGESDRPLHWNGATWCGLARFAKQGTEALCIPRELRTLAEEMRRVGYRTVGVTANELLFRPAGFDRGFDVWIEVGYQGPVSGGVSKLVLRSTRRAELVSRAVLRAVERLGEGRLFVYIHYMDVHDWYVPGYPAYSYRHYKNYKKAVQALDTQIGVLLQALEERGLLDKSVVLFTADHGEALGEVHALETTPAHFGNPSFEQVLNVPLIVAPPLFKETSGLVRSEDIFDLIQKVALSPERRVHDIEPGELFVTEMQYQTYRKGRWKSAQRRADAAVSLFDLVDDPGETRNVAAAHPFVVEAHKRRVGELARSLAASGEQPAALSPSDRQRLQNLGYIQ